MDMVHGELSLADQFARLKVKFKKYVGSTVFVSLQLFFHFFWVRGHTPFSLPRMEILDVAIQIPWAKQRGKERKGEAPHSALL